MANPLRGQVDVEINGRPYTLSMSSDAYKHLEKKTGLNPIAVARALDGEKWTVEMLCTVFKHTLRDHHPDLTEDEKDDLLKHQKITDTLKWVGEVLTGSLDVPEGGAARPTQADSQPPPSPSGTGNGSLQPGNP